MSDASNQTAIERALGHRVLGATPARTVFMRRHYNAPIHAVWAAWTEPERLNRWFLPVSGDLRQGGHFSLGGNASGEILHCEPPHRLLVTWAYWERGEQPPDEVELRLAPAADGGTLLELEHASVDLMDLVLDDTVAGLTGLGTGWELPLTYSLPAYLAGELPDKPAAEWFEMTPEIEAAAQRSGEAWAAVIQAERG